MIRAISLLLTLAALGTPRRRAIHMAGPAGAADRAVSGGLRDRRGQPPGGAEAHDQARPAVRGGEPRRRQRRDRRRHRRQGDAGRHHHGADHREHACAGARARRQAALRHREGLQAGLDDLRRALRAGALSRHSGEERRRPGGARQGEPRQVQLRLGGPRQPRASRRRAVRHARPASS